MFEIHLLVKDAALGYMGPNSRWVDLVYSKKEYIWIKFLDGSDKLCQRIISKENILMIAVKEINLTFNVKEV